MHDVMMASYSGYQAVANVEVLESDAHLHALSHSVVQVLALLFFKLVFLS